MPFKPKKITGSFRLRRQDDECLLRQDNGDAIYTHPRLHFFSGAGAVFGDLFAEFCTADFAKQINDIFERGFHERFGALVLAQNLDAGFMTDTWHLEPFDFEIFLAFAALVRNRKSVRLVAGVLQ